MSKKFINRAIVFTILGLLAGAFYREFTKYFSFKGYTNLSIVHTHLLTLGTFMLLILGILVEVFNVKENKRNIRLLNLYTISVLGTTGTMFFRGLFPVLGWDITKTINYSISGVAGLMHILLTISILWILSVVKSSIRVSR